MAQPVYEQHPLQQYLQDSGDKPDKLPGEYIESPVDSEGHLSDFQDIQRWLPPPLAHKLDTFRQWLTPLFSNRNDDFAERFKYDLISSNLLSSSVASSPVPFRSRFQSPPPPTPTPLPGELQKSESEESLTPQEKTTQELKSLSSAFVFVGLAALFNENRFAAALALLTSLAFTKPKRKRKSSSTDTYIPQVFESLEALKLTASAWDTVVNDTITILEEDERLSSHLSPNSSSSSSSQLRIALHTTLLTTQNQCDHVRPLLAALSAPQELSQLSEMYAPPSPIPSSMQLRPESSPRRRFISLSEGTPLSSSSLNLSALSPDKKSIHRASSTPTISVAEKRQTWNGSYVALAGINPRNSTVLRKRERRRSDLSSLFESKENSGGVRNNRGLRRVSSMSMSVPTSAPPSPASTPLSQVREADEEDIAAGEDGDEAADFFGPAALRLRRKRRSLAVESLNLFPTRSVPSLRSSYHSPSLSSSRFTSLQSSRHPLSLSSLHHALQGAISARRYACSHLLALRFSEDAEDEAYWDNVRSVISLLTTTFEDATARLNEALEDAQRRRDQDSQPSPYPSPSPTPNRERTDNPLSLSTSLSSPSPFRTFQLSSPSTTLFSPTLPTSTNSFAPIPGGLQRFGSHIEAMTSSLEEAKEYMRQCVSSLKEDISSSNTSTNTPLPPTSVDLADEVESYVPVPDDQGAMNAREQTILQSYERIRRELGLALRECERGRAALSDILEARRREAKEGEGREEFDEVPAFSRDSISSGGSGGELEDNKQDAGPKTPDEGSPVMPSFAQILSSHLSPDTSLTTGQGSLVDDVTQHLLLTSTSSHLPAAGIEQVFEAESGARVAFNRERSKVSREERIKLARAKRESRLLNTSFNGSASGHAGLGLISEYGNEQEMDRDRRRGWGPSTEVVAELKDVIWKVGERRRRMTNATPPETVASTTVASSLAQAVTTSVGIGFADDDEHAITTATTSHHLDELASHLSNVVIL